MSKSTNIASPTSGRSRVAEQVLGILGGICGMGAGVAAMFLGAVSSALGDNNDISTAGFGCIAVSFLAIIFAIMVKRNPRLIGWLLIASGVINFITVGLFGILSGLLLVLAGLLTFRK